MWIMIWLPAPRPFLQGAQSVLQMFSYWFSWLRCGVLKAPEEPVWTRVLQVLGETQLSSHQGVQIGCSLQPQGWRPPFTTSSSQTKGAFENEKYNFFFNMPSMCSVLKNISKWLLCLWRVIIGWGFPYLEKIYIPTIQPAFFVSMTQWTMADTEGQWAVWRGGGRGRKEGKENF